MISMPYFSKFFVGTKFSYYFDIFLFQSTNETNLGILDRSNLEFFYFQNSDDWWYDRKSDCDKNILAFELKEHTYLEDFS